jgi:hypothetical protein
MIRYNISRNEDGKRSVTAFINGEPFVAAEEHPNFDDIINFLNEDLAGLENEYWDDDEDESPENVLRDLFDVSIAIGTKFEKVSDRLSISGGEIFLDGDKISNPLGDHIVRMHAAKGDFKSLGAFYEKIDTNPNPHSKEHLFRWLETHNFTITDDGDFLAYKGVNVDFTSCTAGPAIVNGEYMQGHIPNNPGNIVEMPRSAVKFDPTEGCSSGLHAGTWGYASTFGPVTVLVKINPHDVVSVPTDSGDAKLRTCRYTVLRQVTSFTEAPYEAIPAEEIPAEPTITDEQRETLYARVRTFFGKK